MTATLDRFRDELAALLDPRLYPLAWVEEQIATGAIGLMANDTALIGVQIRRYPGGAKEIHAMFACGDLPGVLELADAACELGKRRGCERASVASREGWARALRSRGFVPHQLEIVKEL